MSAARSWTPRSTPEARTGRGRRVREGAPKLALRRDPLPAWVDLLLLAILFAAAMIPWWPVYESPAFLTAATVSVLVGFAIAAVCAYSRSPAWAVAVAVVAAYLFFGVPAAIPSRAALGIFPTPAGLVDLVGGAALSWKQLVTVSAPVGSYQALLVPVFLLGLVAATVAATIALRTRHPVFALIPPAAVFAAGIAFGVVHAQFAAVSGLAFLGASVAWLVRVAIGRKRSLGAGRPVEAALADARRVLGGSAILALALVGAATAAVAVPTPQRTVIRSELQPPFEPRDLVSPLAGFRSAFTLASRERPMLEVSGLPPGMGLRVATLDTYDGVVFTVGGDEVGGLSGRFTRLPYRLDQSSVDGAPVRLDVTVLDYDDVWVPGVGSLERIEFAGPRAAALSDGFVYNDVTGAAAVQGGFSSGDRFTAWSMVPEPVGDLAGVRPGTMVLPPSPPLPPRLSQFLDEHTADATTAGERLAAVVRALREGYVSHGQPGEEPSRSGHALDRLERLTTERPMVGDGEQYAALTALLAREIGFPARVVVGYLPTEPPVETADTGVAFLGGDRQAWVEIQTDDGLWRQLDPNPEPRDILEREPDEPTVVSRPQSALPPPEPRTPVDELDDRPDASPEDRSTADSTWAGVLASVALWTGGVLAGAAILASPFLAVIAAKLRRRRIRRGADSEAKRIEGGWADFADTAVDYGFPVAPTATRSEQAAGVGGLDAIVLAGVIDRMLFSPGGIPERADERVWAAVDDLRGRFAAEAGLRGRIRAAISLGSLGGYAVTRRGGRS
ncbi:transglutaminaseTgpA domain-containing protein [Agromyces protaetiae]|uniref:transglutaminaseTgpA domain-containing protein n=1 Tax=Agromyces protaetiae TaxID=2509455 RepID=UPI0013EC98A0|nr:transglutaminaseTgpA domain-containing protein [Agromyces protaetiae]